MMVIEWFQPSGREYEWFGPTGDTIAAIQQGGTSAVASVIGERGEPGTDGVGVAIGGTLGQVLAKASATDYDTEWVDQTGGGGFASPTIPAFTDVTDAALDTLIESNTVVVAGDADTVWPAVVRGDGSPQVQVNAGAWGTSGIFRVGDILKLRATSADTGLVSRTVNIYAQGVSSPWVITTTAIVDPIAPLFANGEQGVWYDPSDLTTLFQDTAGTTPVTTAGQTVALMLDKSGNDLHATQATAAARPTYQTDGTLHWLECDGVDDFMVTPTITPGTDKVQVFAGVRKLSDANTTFVVEYSASVGSNNGSFAMAAPSGSQPTYDYRSKGTTLVTLASTTDFAAPITNVLSGLGNISGDLANLRVDGTQNQQSTADQGAGNYLAYPMYIGARAGTSLFFNGNIYSLVTRFGANLETATIEQVETYTADKSGVILA